MTFAEILDQAMIMLLRRDRVTYRTLKRQLTILWRFALPRAGWWRKAPRSRLPTRPLSPRPIKHEESLKRDAWGCYRSWSRITSGVLLSIIGAVQYGTSKVF
jgi:hypothetical protein